MAAGGSHDAVSFSESAGCAMVALCSALRACHTADHMSACTMRARALMCARELGGGGLEWDGVSLGWMSEVDGMKDM